jgi:MFS family permease
VVGTERQASLRFVDAQGNPVDTGRLYRSWATGFAVVAVFAGYSAFAEPPTERFSVGAWAGGSVTAALFAGMYVFGWWNDRRHVTESRQYWVSRHARTTRVMIVVPGLLITPSFAALVTALNHSRDFVAGLSFGPLLGAITLLLVGITGWQQQRKRSG